MSEMELIQRAQAGERDAIVQLLRKLETPIYRTAYYFMSNEQDALDVTQEALIRIYKYLPNFKGDSKLHTWVQKIVTHVCMDHFRKRRQVIWMREETWYEDQKAKREIEQGTMITDLKQAIEQLPDSQRTAVLLRYVHDYNYQEIAETMQLPINTVKSHLFRARKQLQVWLADYQEGGKSRWEMK